MTVVLQACCGKKGETQRRNKMEPRNIYDTYSPCPGIRLQTIASIHTLSTSAAVIWLADVPTHHPRAGPESGHARLPRPEADWPQRPNGDAGVRAQARLAVVGPTAVPKRSVWLPPRGEKLVGGRSARSRFARSARRGAFFPGDWFLCLAGVA